MLSFCPLWCPHSAGCSEILACCRNRLCLQQVSVIRAAPGARALPGSRVLWLRLVLVLVCGLLSQLLPWRAGQAAWWRWPEWRGGEELVGWFCHGNCPKIPQDSTHDTHWVRRGAAARRGVAFGHEPLRQRVAGGTLAAAAQPGDAAGAGQWKLLGLEETIPR